MKTLKAILIAASLLVPVFLGAQTKAETNLYNKTVKKPSVKAADKFLKKYPNSVYSPKVLHIKDSLLLMEFREGNVSLISKEDALAAAGETLDAVGWKKDGKEHVLALDKGFNVRTLTPDGIMEDSRYVPVYTMEETELPVSVVLPMEVVSPLGERRNYVHWAYRNGDSEYVEVLYLPEEDILHQALFYGVPMAGEPGKIEGQCPEMMEGLVNSAEVCWLTERLRQNPDLVPIAKADLLTDESIRWWLEKNPKAESAQRLTFGQLDPESSVAEACKAARKEKGKGYGAAVLDIRGYTVICSVSYKTGEYTLVWCEPVCRNKKTDRHIKDYFFENDGTTLDVVYIKGNTMSKHKISLLSHSVQRMKY